MASTSRTLGILVTHGSLGEELRRTAEAILGPQEQLEVISNFGASLDGIVDRVREILKGRAASAVFLFVDLLGGSCGHACREILRAHDDTTILSGINLPMLLDFLHNRDRYPMAELRERLVQKGRDGIQCIG
ncbi:MAG: PTS sugar transporter subunit IIA [Candidatus Eisenbacteria bacterium]|nr:hypothetical protein [Candidatus Eisenbacteria bacterium]